jgi:tRNA1(Val) A37 N6-methylase TrmN6
MTAAEKADTIDAFLGGRVEAIQPAGGHRSGLDAVLLAAAVDRASAGTVIDLGAGVGVAGMCVAARCLSASVVLVDRDRAALASAGEALALPANRNFAARVSLVAADVGESETAREAAGLARSSADLVITNPPYRAAGEGTRSPHASRASAHVLDSVGLDPWLRTAASVLKPDGALIAIFRADGLDELLKAIAGRFGGAAILPLHPRAGLRAHLVLLRAVKGSRAPLALLPGFALHGSAGGTYLPEAEAILRGGAGLGDVHPPWRQG